ncbi:hypothetical protein D3C81_1741150 [compost metagenome]
MTATTTFNFDVTVRNDAVAGTQRITSVILNGTTIAQALTSASIDTTVAQTIAIEAECAAAGESIILRMMKIRGLD